MEPDCLYEMRCKGVYNRIINFDLLELRCTRTQRFVLYRIYLLHGGHYVKDFKVSARDTRVEYRESARSLQLQSRVESKQVLLHFQDCNSLELDGFVSTLLSIIEGESTIGESARVPLSSPSAATAAAAGAGEGVRTPSSYGRTRKRRLDGYKPSNTLHTPPLTPPPTTIHKSPFKTSLTPPGGSAPTTPTGRLRLTPSSSKSRRRLPPISPVGGTTAHDRVQRHLTRADDDDVHGGDRARGRIRGARAAAGFAASLHSEQAPLQSIPGASDAVVVIEDDDDKQRRRPSPSSSPRPPPVLRSEEGIRGLKNIGNSCYLNSCVSALLHADAFSRRLASFLRLTSRACREAHEASFSSRLHLLFERMRRSTSLLPLEPRRLLETFAQRHPRFSGREQQDAHEFLSEFVNHISEDLRSLRSALLPCADTGTATDASPPPPLPTEFAFQARTQYTLSCTDCSYTRSNYENCFDYSLDLPSVPDVDVSVVAAAAAAAPGGVVQRCPEHGTVHLIERTSKRPHSRGRRFVKCQAMDCRHFQWIKPTSCDADNAAEGNKDAVDAVSTPPSHDLRELLGAFFMPRVQPLRCEKCGGANVKIESRMKELPRVLVLHLKRFKADLVRNTYEKSNVEVSIPLQLEVGSCCADEALAPISSCVFDTVLEAFSRRIECGRAVEKHHDADNAEMEAEAEVEEVEGKSHGGGLARKKLSFAGEKLSDVELTNLSENEQIQIALQASKLDFNARQTQKDGLVRSAAPLSPIYELRSIVHHLGPVSTSGHYIHDVLEPRTKRWTRFDDSIVKPIDEKRVLDDAKQQGYIMFYVYEGE